MAAELKTGDSISHSVLKNKDGEVVEIQDVFGELKLCAVEQQNKGINAPLVTISTRSRNEKNQVALHFKHKSASYALKVDGKSLTLDSAVDTNNLSNISDNCWFEKGNEEGGKHYLLRSAVEPNYCLYVRDEERYRVFSLSDDNSKGVLVTVGNTE